MTKVCFVCGNIYPLLDPSSGIPIVGGAEVQQLLIGTELSKRGLGICYITEDYGQGSYVFTNGLPTFAYSFGRNKIRQAMSLWQAFHYANADVYYVRGMPRFGIEVYMFCRNHQRKIIQALANDYEVVHSGTMKLYDRLNYGIHAFWRVRADLVIAQTHYQQQMLRHHWHTEAVVIPNFVIADRFSKKDNYYSHPLRVLWVGAVSPRKRLEILGQVADHLPGMQFTVVGGPAREMDTYYNKVKSQIMPRPNVRWHGHVSHETIKSFYENADLLLHTADGRTEGFPNVFLEAWANGVPTISLGADPDQIIQRFNLGFCCDSIEEVVRVLRQIATAPETLSVMAQHALEYVATMHGPDVIVPKYLDIIGKLTSPRL